MPGGQRHSPVMWWQAASGGHWQRRAQASPNQPGGQAAGRHGPGEPGASAGLEGSPGAGGAGGSPLSHREPLHPGGQRQAPVMWWQAAPRRQAQRSSQSAPNLPSAQATGQDGKGWGRRSPAPRPGPRPSHGDPGRSGQLAALPRTRPWSGAPGPPRTGPQPIPLTALTLVPRPAGGAEAAARVRVTSATMATPTAARAPGSGAPWEALCSAGMGGGHLLGRGYDPRTPMPPLVSRKERCGGWSPCRPEATPRMPSLP